MNEEIENNRLLARDAWLFKLLPYADIICYALAVACAVLWCAGCAATSLPHRPQAQSSDQQTLHDEVPAGNKCPAVYDAPNGNLRFCM